MSLLSKTETTTEDYSALNNRVLAHQLENNYPISHIHEKGEIIFYVNSLDADNVYYEDTGDQDESWLLILDYVNMFNIPIDEKYKIIYLINGFNDTQYVISQYVVLKEEFEITQISEIIDYVIEEQKEYVLQMLEKV